MSLRTGYGIDAPEIIGSAFVRIIVTRTFQERTIELNNSTIILNRMLAVVIYQFFITGLA